MRRFISFLVAALVISSAMLTPSGLVQAAGQANTREACPANPPPGYATCFSLVRTDVQGVAPGPNVSTNISGFGPTDLSSAYDFNPRDGWGQTVAIVDAFDDPEAETDLARYRGKFGIEPCTSVNRCFQKVNQYGQQGNYPTANPGWAEEISLDLDMVSAICPRCHILLVEANSNAYMDLLVAENEAAVLGATEISNSWGSGEFSGEAAYSSTYFNHPGIAITASSGDGGYGVEFPAASEFVTAVGGTSLVRNPGTTRGWSESAWAGAGSGCSAYIAKPSWQAHDRKCFNRTVADVSAIADPATGVAVYDTYIDPGWEVFGGTSVASPIIASVYALAGNAAWTVGGSHPYEHKVAFNDITTGSNGNCGTYLCYAREGYDGPTGLGTPWGHHGY